MEKSSISSSQKQWMYPGSAIFIFYNISSTFVHINIEYSPSSSIFNHRIQNLSQQHHLFRVLATSLLVAGQWQAIRATKWNVALRLGTESDKHVLFKSYAQKGRYTVLVKISTHVFYIKFIIK